MKEIMRAAHKMAKEIKTEYSEVDYKTQLGLCIKYLLEERKEAEATVEVKLNTLAEKHLKSHCFKNVYTQIKNWNNKRIYVNVCFQGRQLYVYINKETNQIFQQTGLNAWQRALRDEIASLVKENMEYLVSNY